MRRARGFTLVELVAVLLIAAILAIFVSGTLDTRSFDTITFAEEVRAQISYAQKLAVAARRPVTVRVSGNAITLRRCLDFGCAGNAPVNSIRGNASLEPKANSNIAVATNAPGGEFTFDALGSVPASVTVSLVGDQTITITVEARTGYVH